MIAIALTLALAPALALAQPRPGGPPPGDSGFGPLHHVLGQLNLTAEQRASIDTIVDTHRQSAAAGREQTMTARQALAESVRAEVFDEGRIRQAAAAVAAADAERAVATAKALQEVRAVLTPDQQKQLQQALSQPRPMRGHRGPHDSAPGGHRGPGHSS
jgi:Spy/CpxP family protein refolding chaperone